MARENGCDLCKACKTLEYVSETSWVYCSIRMPANVYLVLLLCFMALWPKSFFFFVFFHCFLLGFIVLIISSFCCWGALECMCSECFMGHPELVIFFWTNKEEFVWIKVSSNWGNRSGTVRWGFLFGSGTSYTIEVDVLVQAANPFWHSLVCLIIRRTPWTSRRDFRRILRRKKLSLSICKEKR